MSKYRVVRFTDPQEYIAVCKLYDDSFINFPFGAVLDFLNPIQTPILEHDPVPLTMFVVYRDETAITFLAKVPFEFAWMLGVPANAETSLSEPDLAVVASMLPPAITEVVEPKVFTELFGAKRLADALLAAWTAHVETLGIRANVLAPFGLTARITYATKSSVAPPLASHSHFKVERAKPEDIESLIPLYIDFVTPLPQPATREAATQFFNGTVKLRRTWLVRVDGHAAGYCVVARITPKTASIRTVYVSPNYRHRGIAEAMTSAVTRFYLGVEPLGMDVAPPTPDEVRNEVCLGVVKESVERIYRRCGYLLDREDPSTGKIGWVATTIREIQYVE